jgi:8-amino-7-oxononanoate synthase
MTPGFSHRLKYLEEHSLLRAKKTVEQLDGTNAVIDGKRCTLFCANDYLGLSGHPAVKAAAVSAIDEFGFGSGSAPLISGNSIYHKKLAGDIADYKASETSLLFGSGYTANISIIPALAGKGDAIISDSLNHASIIDGCRLSRADVKIYRHCDMDSLAACLEQSKDYKRRLIITEGVFSMDGDIAPLPEIVKLAEEYDATVLVDEAHATGTIGPSGRGSLEHFNIKSDRIIQMGTLGKALGSFGAFAASTNDTIDWLTNSARGFIFSTALPHSACASASAALRVIIEEPDRLDSLRKNSETLRSSLTGMGFKVLGGGTPIVPVMTGGAEETLRLASYLMESGFYAPAIRPPTVPENECRIRLTVSALHKTADIEALMDVFRKT